MKVKKAVIPAAGLGTRFLPAVKAQPKEMLPIVDKPTLQYIIEEAVASGIEEILLITGRGKQSIENHFDRSIELEMALESSGKTEMLSTVRAISDMADIHYIRQKEPRGLGHAIYCARHFIGNEPFAILLGDDVVYNREDPALAQLIRVYDAMDGSVLGVQEVPYDQAFRYGIVDGTDVGDGVLRVKTMVEKPPTGQQPTNIAVLGRYVLQPTVMDILGETKPGVGGEIQLTDALVTLAEREPVFAAPFVGRRYDIGDKLGFLKATVEYALRDPALSEGFADYLRSFVDGGLRVES